MHTPTVLFLNIPQKSIIQQDVSQVKEFIRSLRPLGSRACQSVAMFIEGYDDVVEEMYEIPEVRKWIRKLLNEVPYLFYYLKQDLQDIPGGPSGEYDGVAWILGCLSDEYTFVTPEGRKPISAYPLGSPVPRIHATFVLPGKTVHRFSTALLKHGVEKKDATGAATVIEKLLRIVAPKQ